MPTIITIDGVTLTLKKYPEFTPGTPVATDITLFSDPVNGNLFKTTMDNLIANILNVDGSTITGDGSSGNPLVASSGITADNGLTIDPAGNVRLGTSNTNGVAAALLHDSYINNAGFFLEFVDAGTTTQLAIINQAAASNSTNAAFYVESKTTNQDAASAIFANLSFSTGINGVGIQSFTGGGIAGRFTSSYGAGGGSSGSDVVPVLTVERGFDGGGGGAGSGLGGMIQFRIDTTSQSLNSSATISNQLISKWTDATNASRTSQIIITGVLSASTVDLITLNGDGSWQIRPITATAASAITPAEGMMLFVSTTDATFTTIGFWGYSNGAWAAF